MNRTITRAILFIAALLATSSQAADNTAAFILILFAHVGPAGDGNSNALTTAEFIGEQACVAAGNRAKTMANGTVKRIEFVCVPKQVNWIKQ
jgi:hypothetical protein